MYHPNIDLEGNVCLNILREDWKPVLSINSVIYGLQFLFLVRTRSAHLRLRIGHPQAGAVVHMCLLPAVSYAKMPWVQRVSAVLLLVR